MLQLSIKDRFSFRSARKVCDSIGIAYQLIKCCRPEFDGRSLSREMVFNAVFSYFGSLPLEDQVRIYDAGIAKFQQMLKESEGPEVVPALMPRARGPVTKPAPASTPLGAKEVRTRGRKAAVAG